MRGDQRIVRGQCGKFVGRTFEWYTARSSQFRCNAVAEFGMGVQPRSHCRAADRQFVKRCQRMVDHRLRQIELRDVSGKFLPQRQRGRIL